MKGPKIISGKNLTSQFPIPLISYSLYLSLQGSPLFHDFFLPSFQIIFFLLRLTNLPTLFSPQPSISQQPPKDFQWMMIKYLPLHHQKIPTHYNLITNTHFKYLTYIIQFIKIYIYPRTLQQHSSTLMPKPNQLLQTINFTSCVPDIFLISKIIHHKMQPFIILLLFFNCQSDHNYSSNTLFRV